MEGERGRASEGGRAREGERGRVREGGRAREGERGMGCAHVLEADGGAREELLRLRAVLGSSCAHEDRERRSEGKMEL
eukprot:2683739-Pleurochrysis_carterae.AAC.1